MSVSPFEYVVEIPGEPGHHAFQVASRVCDGELIVLDGRAVLVVSVEQPTLDQSGRIVGERQPLSGATEAGPPTPNLD